MRKIIIAALAVTALAGCSSSNDKAEPTPVPSTSAPTFDKNAALHEAWTQARDTYPAELKLSICDAASKGGASEVEAVLTNSDDMPFVVEHPEYDAKQWVTYCASGR